jgi:hypothetical protein
MMGPASLPAPPELLAEDEPTAPLLLEPDEPPPPAAASALPAEDWFLRPHAEQSEHDVPSSTHATSLVWLAIADPSS